MLNKTLERGAMTEEGLCTLQSTLQHEKEIAYPSADCCSHNYSPVTIVLYYSYP